MKNIIEFFDQYSITLQDTLNKIRILYLQMLIFIIPNCGVVVLGANNTLCFSSKTKKGSKSPDESAVDEEVENAKADDEFEEEVESGSSSSASTQEEQEEKDLEAENEESEAVETEMETEIETEDDKSNQSAGKQDQVASDEDIVAEYVMAEEGIE